VHTFRRTFPSELYRVKPALHDALVFIRTHITALPEDDEGDLRLILSELLLNAVIHGNRGDMHKTVVLALDIADGTVSCAITDEGDGFDHRALLAGFGAEDDCESEHGRGVRIAYALTDTMQFNVSGNTIFFRKKVSRGA